MKKKSNESESVEPGKVVGNKRKGKRGREGEPVILEIYDLTDGDHAESAQSDIARSVRTTRSSSMRSAGWAPVITYVGVPVGKSDLRTLDAGEFLNDTIIDFYAQWIAQQMSPETKARTHIFSSFLYAKLVSIDKDRVGHHPAKWTDGVDIFSKDFVFIPICEKLH